MEYVIIFAIVFIAIPVVVSWSINDSTTRARRVTRTKHKERSRRIARILADAEEIQANFEKRQAVYEEKRIAFEKERAAYRERQARHDAEKRARTEERWARLEQEQALRKERRLNPLKFSQKPRAQNLKKPTAENRKRPSDYSRLYGRDSAWN